MKNIFIAGVVGFLTLSVYAKDASNTKHEKNCRMYMEMANTIMKQKQNGMPLIKALEANEEVDQEI